MATNVDCVAALARLDLGELSDDLEALGLGEPRTTAEREPFRIALFDRGARCLAGHLSEGMNLFLSAERLGREAAVVARRFASLPLGAWPAAPYVRNTMPPRTAGARDCRPLRFDLARRLQCQVHRPMHGVVPPIFVRPSPRAVVLTLPTIAWPALGIRARRFWIRLSVHLSRGANRSCFQTSAQVPAPSRALVSPNPSLRGGFRPPFS